MAAFFMPLKRASLIEAALRAGARCGGGGEPCHGSGPRRAENSVAGFLLIFMTGKTFCTGNAFIDFAPDNDSLHIEP